MPKCYSIIISVSSSLDPSTNMWNLAGLVDNIQTRDLPIVIPLHTHVFWYFAPEEIGKDFEARISLSINSTRMEPSEPIAFSSSTPYTHLRLLGVLLDRIGEYHTYVEWRRTGCREWIREDVFWPFIVRIQSA
jgi:hypothetical protein